MGGAWRDTSRFLCVLLVVAAIHFFRDPGSFLLPTLAYEDGRDMFAFFYNHRDLAEVLRFYNGYISLIPNLVGHLAISLPIQWVPSALALFPLVTASLAFSLFSLPAYRYLVASDSCRFVISLALALFPLANSLFISNTTYSIWALLLILVWLSLAPAPRHLGDTMTRLPVMAALIWSHPLSVALVPVYGAAAWNHRRRRSAFFYGALVAVAIAYQIFGVEPSRQAIPIGRVVHLSIAFTLERVVFASLLGDSTLQYLRRLGAEALIPTTAAVILFASAFVTVRFRRRLQRAQVLALATLLYLVAVFTALYILGRSPDLDILEAGRAFRYFWVQRVLFLASLAILAEAAFGADHGSLGRGTSAALLWLFACYLSMLNFNNNGNYGSRARWGRAVAAFTVEVARQEAAGGGVEAGLERGIWSIRLRQNQRSAIDPDLP